MFATVYGVSQNPASLVSLVIAEAMGSLLLWAGIFGMRRNASSAARLLQLVTVLGIGLVLTLGAAANLQGVGGGRAISTITFGVVSLIFAVFAVFQWSRDCQAQSWPKVQATIEESEAREVRTRSTHYFVAQFAYSYEVDGEYYSGRYERTFDTESEASDYEQALRGGKIPVSVNPKKPDDSQVLNPPTLS